MGKAGKPNSLGLSKERSENNGISDCSLFSRASISISLVFQLYF